MVLAIAISATLFVFLVSAIGWYGYPSCAKPGQVLDRIGSAGEVTGTPETGIEADRRFRVTTVLQWVGQKIPRSPEGASVNRKVLSMAVYRSESAVPIYVALRSLAIGAFALGSFTGARYAQLSMLIAIGLAAAGAYIGSMVSSIMLDQLVKGRQERLRFSLPDALDLLVVC